MTEAAVAVPIRAGRTDAWRQALGELLGPRYGEYEASRRRFGITAQTTFLQRTSMGDFAVIRLAGPDVHASFHAMSASTDPWDVSWRDLTLDLHGMDFAQGERVMPRVEPAFSMEGPSLPNARAFLFVVPLTDADAFRALASELMGSRHDDYVRARAQLGIQRESVFLQRSAMGPAAVFYWLAPDPVGSLRRLRDSTADVDRWLMSEAATLHPVPLETLSTTIGSNTLIADYPHARP